MLEDVLKNKKCFKLVCGAGNQDEIEVEKLVALYSKAGCNFFDLCAKPEILAAAKRGLDHSIAKAEQENFYLCASVGIKGDPHVSKAKITQESCVSCGKCAQVCLQSAISQCEKSFFVHNKRCIGCGKCEKVCPSNCVSMQSENVDLKEVLPPLVAMGIDCIELHAMGEAEAEVDEKWADINKNFDGLLSICVGRSKLGNEKLFKRVKRLLANRAPYTTIIQADGAPMSGGADDFKTTLQTVAMAEIFQDADLPIYVIISGGTNSKSVELANLCGISINGVAIGTFARTIVKEYIDRDDFLQNPEVFNKALEIAKGLVDVTMKNLSC